MGGVRGCVYAWNSEMIILIQLACQPQHHGYLTLVTMRRARQDVGQEAARHTVAPEWRGRDSAAPFFLGSLF